MQKYKVLSADDPIELQEMMNDLYEEDYEFVTFTVTDAAIWAVMEYRSMHAEPPPYR